MDVDSHLILFWEVSFRNLTLELGFGIQRNSLVSSKNHFQEEEDDEENKITNYKYLGKECGLSFRELKENYVIGVWGER